MLLGKSGVVMGRIGPLTWNMGDAEYRLKPIGIVPAATTGIKEAARAGVVDARIKHGICVHTDTSVALNTVVQNTIEQAIRNPHSSKFAQLTTSQALSEFQQRRDRQAKWLRRVVLISAMLGAVITLLDLAFYAGVPPFADDLSSLVVASAFIVVAVIAFLTYRWLPDQTKIGFGIFFAWIDMEV